MPKNAPKSMQSPRLPELAEVSFTPAQRALAELHKIRSARPV